MKLSMKTITIWNWELGEEVGASMHNSTVFSNSTARMKNPIAFDTFLLVLVTINFPL